MKKTVFMLMALVPIVFISCNDNDENITIDSVVEMNESGLDDLFSEDVDFNAFITALDTKSFRQVKEYRNTDGSWEDFTFVPGDAPAYGFYIDGDSFIGIKNGMQRRDFYFDCDNKSIHTLLDDEILDGIVYDGVYECEAKLKYFKHGIVILEGEICYAIDCYGPGSGQGWTYRYVGVMDDEIRSEWEYQYNN